MWRSVQRDALFLTDSGRALATGDHLLVLDEFAGGWVIELIAPNARRLTFRCEGNHGP